MPHLTSDQPTPQTDLSGNFARKKKRLALALAFAALLLVYIASPYVSVWNFIQAVRARDADALASRVDFPRLRDSIKAQINARFSPPSPAPQPKKKDRIAAFLMSNAPSLVDQLLDSYMTPDGIALLLAKPEIMMTPESVLAGPPPHSVEPTTSGGTSFWSKVHYAFFTGPREFLVDYNGTELRFRFYGAGWRLIRIGLPAGPSKSSVQG